MLGWRGRLGFIYPACGRRDYEFGALVPEGVSTHFARVPFGGRGDLATVSRMSERENLIGAAQLLGTVGLDVISWADTSGSFFMGVAGARQQAAEIGEAASAAGSSTSVALLEACMHMGVSSLSVASPYLSELNQALEGFLAEAGIKVTELGELALENEREISFLPEETMARLALRVGRSGEALFIPCTDTPAVDLIPSLEEDLGKPVLTANQVTVWRALTLAEIPPVAAMGGRLMSDGW